ncbi:hypothetical protein [Amycolatopsis taiwanensis]|uniref:hypothetical protein n=1 Tax=Amycolatopsis taiwanensis TaxID=342230 RepID=UPI0004BC1AA7|nr:hypothetical protein [Amycolatopsis taiwanensis]
MDSDERSIDELIEIAEEIPDRLGLAAGMQDLRGSAQGEGVSVTVDVQGMLVDLDITDKGLALGPQRLAAEISRLSTEAGGKVLREGLRAVKAGTTPQIAAAIADYLGIDVEEPVSPVEPEQPARSEQPARPARRSSRPDEDDESEGFVLRPV